MPETYRQAFPNEKKYQKFNLNDVGLCGSDINIAGYT